MKVDGNLLIDLKNGDEKALRLYSGNIISMYIILFTRYYMKIYGSGDLTQNVFLIWEKHETIDPEQKL